MQDQLSFIFILNHQLENRDVFCPWEELITTHQANQQINNPKLKMWAAVIGAKYAGLFQKHFQLNIKESIFGRTALWAVKYLNRQKVCTVRQINSFLITANHWIANT